MRSFLQKSGYILDRLHNIWISPNYEGIAYSDGDEVEERIARVIKKATDITVLSTELRRHCTDWPSLYHLSGTRANLLRPFEHILRGNILEVGAGCGAITRFLGEGRRNVLALEGSPRRAAIARSRTRDLENVTVVAESLERFQCDLKFDLITLIGVLEYANLFITGENPPLAMLKRVRSMLKPKGTLIIAIENQLGLKYFAGAPEDHLGQPMIGIEGRYGNNQPQTFGRKVLANLLEQSGFAASEFLAPFPDYKLPVSILTEHAFADNDFDASALACQSARRDPQMPAYCNFSLELAWPEIIENGLGMETANSFLVAASPAERTLTKKNVLAYHYAAERKPEFCKEAVFTKTESGEISVTYRRLGKPARTKNKKNNDLIRFVLPESDKYVFGKPLSLEFVRIVTRDGWSFDQLARFIWRYLSMVEAFTGAESSRRPLASAHTRISGEYFDLVPQNIIVLDDDSTIWIDREWRMEFSVEVGYLLFRSLLLLMSSVTRFGRHSSGAGLTRYQFIDGVFAAVGMGQSEDGYERYVALEADIQQKVSGQPAENFLDWRKDELLPISVLTHAVKERDGKIASLNQSISELEGKITGLNHEIAERDEQISGLNQVVVERDSRLGELNQSVMENRVEIASLNQAVAERDVQIIGLNNSVKELEGKLTGLKETNSEFEAQIAVLNRIGIEREEKIANLGQVVSARDEQLISLDQTLKALQSEVKNRDEQIRNFKADKDQVELSLREVESLLMNIQASRSWRFTRPLRTTFEAMREFKVYPRRIGSLSFQILRTIYRRLPANHYRKRQLKTFAYRHFSRFLQNTGSYREWAADGLNQQHVMNGLPTEPGPTELTASCSQVQQVAPHSRTEPQSLVAKVIKKTVWAANGRHDPYDNWVKVNKWNSKRETRLRERLQQIEDPPLLSVVMPVYNPPIEFLNRAIETVRAQVYANWELCIADDASTQGWVGDVLTRWTETDKRIKILFRETNGNISAATNTAASLAEGSYLVFLDQDDELTPDALGEIALYIAENPEVDIVYSDDDKIDMEGRRFAPQFKPEWSPELLLSYMYFAHVFVLKRSLFEEVGGARIGFEGSQDYDLALRASEKARKIGHIPLVLYHWRVLPGSTSSSGLAKPHSLEAGRKAVQDALTRRGVSAVATLPNWALEKGVGIFSHKFTHSAPPGVTIVIPTKDSVEVLKRCVDSVLSRTDYPNYEVLIVDNESIEETTIDYLKQIARNQKVRTIQISNPENRFNFAHINNEAVKSVDSEYVLFLNNDTEVLNKEWLSQMIGYAQLPGVGVVGARLLYPDRKVQHAGVLIKFFHGLAGHAFKGLTEEDSGYLSYAKVLRNYSAVTAACLLTSRKLFLTLGGFDDQNFKVAYNDVDYCGKLLENGFRIVYTPYAELIHHEGLSRGSCDDPREGANFKTKYYSRKGRYYNPSLSMNSEYFEIWPRAVFTGDFHHTIKTLMCSHNLNLEGAPFSQFEMALGLKQRRVIDPVVLSPKDGPLRHLYEMNGIRVIVDEHLGPKFDIPGYHKRVDALTEFVKGFGVEMVYANTMINFHVIAAAKNAGLPSVWNIRESEPFEHYEDWWGAELASEAFKCFAFPYKVVFVAHATRHSFRNFESENNFHVIHNGLNLQRIRDDAAGYDREKIRQELGIKDDEVALLLPGTVCDRKGQHDLVRALGVLESDALRKVKCFIVGDRKCAYSDELHAIVENLHEDAKSRIAIFPITSEIYRFYKAADIFICTSRIESFPRVVLEAMAFDLPIITTPVFGIPEQVQRDVNALYFSPGNHKALAIELAKLLNNDTLRSTFARNSKYVLRQLETFDEMVENYTAVFREGYLSEGGVPRMPEAIATFRPKGR